MIVGVPKEIKTHEYRVGIVPWGVHSLSSRGHKVLIQKGAGAGIGVSDEEFAKAGAHIVDTAAEVYSRSDMVMKVKEPLPPEYSLMREGQIVYTYFHLAAVPELAKVLMDRKVTAIAYETIQTEDGALPLLKPMSEVAGKMAVQVGAFALERHNEGKGVLLGGVPGVNRGKVVIIGGGVVGTNAAKVAIGMGAQVTVLDVNLNRLEYLEDIFGTSVDTRYSDPYTIETLVRQADLVVGAVLLAGARAPILVSEKLVSQMEPGSVIVDVAVDQGGCVETVHPTTHENPTFVKHGVVHYCVANMPGAVPRTSAYALTNTTLQFALMLADLGAEEAARRSEPLAKGFNCYKGRMVHQAVAESLGHEYTPLKV
ncbi:MAG: Alanine dehydrogenase [Myxococcota bacterium]|nr:Alanine dehydrogenase [Myxococcota bacterium]